MRRLLLIALTLLTTTAVHAQFNVTAHQVGWDAVPPQACRAGFSVQMTVTAQMDDDPQLEDVVLFGHDNGHWPEFDLFKAYYAVIGRYSKEVKYISPTEYVTDRYNLLVEDRNNDGIGELYISYIEEGSFSVDERGYNMQATRCYDRIEFVKDVGQ